MTRLGVEVPSAPPALVRPTVQFQEGSGWEKYMDGLQVLLLLPLPVLKLSCITWDGPMEEEQHGMYTRTHKHAHLPVLRG